MSPYPSLMPDGSYSPDLSGASYRVGDWTLCTRTNRLTRGGDRVELESRLVSLLVTLADHPGQVLDKAWLLQTVWAGRTVTDESLLVAISQLRKALGDDSRAPAYVKTIPGRGYQLVAKAGRIAAPARRRIRWDIVVPAAAVASLVVGLTVRALVPPSGWQTAQNIERDVVYNDPASLKAAVARMRVVAEETPSARTFTSLARLKKRLMGDALAQPDNCREIIGLLDKAIAMDARDERPYALRADTRFLCRHDAAGAEADYLTALGLAPDDDDAALGLAAILLAQGRFEESLERIREARRINPLHYSAPQAVWLYQMQGKDDLAFGELKRMEGAGADDRWFHISAMRVHARAGRDAEAFSHLEWLMRAEKMAEADIASARRALEAGGMKAVYGWLLARKETADLGHYTPPLSWARYALAAGETGQAMIHLEQAFANHQRALMWAEVDPAYTSLRHDPRFRAWVAKMKTPVN